MTSLFFFYGGVVSHWAQLTLRRHWKGRSFPPPCILCFILKEGIGIISISPRGPSAVSIPNKQAQAGSQKAHRRTTEDHRVGAAFVRLYLQINVLQAFLCQKPTPPRVRVGRVQRWLRVVHLSIRPNQLSPGWRIIFAVFLKAAQFLLEKGVGAVFIQKPSQF